MVNFTKNVQKLLKFRPEKPDGYGINLKFRSSCNAPLKIQTCTELLEFQPEKSDGFGIHLEFFNNSAVHVCFSEKPDKLKNTK